MHVPPVFNGARQHSKTRNKVQLAAGACGEPKGQAGELACLENNTAAEVQLEKEEKRFKKKSPLFQRKKKESKRIVFPPMFSLPLFLSLSPFSNGKRG